MDEKTVTACLIIIGNEILSGRTVDANLPHLAKKLGEIGIRLAEARVVPDIEQEIVDAVNTCRAKHDYVFTTGGIGPTHDDITSAAVAKAFGLPFGRNPEAEALLLDYYPPEKVNEARLSMADTPEGAELIANPVSIAPGFRVENVYVMAGVPKIMQAMLDNVLPTLEGGAVVLSRSVTMFMPEGEIALHLKVASGRAPRPRHRQLSFLRLGRPGIDHRLSRHRPKRGRPSRRRPPEDRRRPRRPHHRRPGTVLTAIEAAQTGQPPGEHRCRHPPSRSKHR